MNTVKEEYFEKLHKNIHKVTLNEKLVI